MISPCKDCKKRQLGCHSSCNDYAEWRHNLDEYNTLVKEAREKEKLLRDYEIKRNLRSKRK